MLNKIHPNKFIKYAYIPLINLDYMVICIFFSLSIHISSYFHFNISHSFLTTG